MRVPVTHKTLSALFCGVGIVLLLIAPASAFTADSLNITITDNGDATAVFRFTLEGIVENAIPLSVLQDELVKGLDTSSEPPQVLTFSNSEATLLLKNFAVLNDVPTGTEYQTTPMDFKKAQFAFEGSAVSHIITADFSPKQLTITFPDGFKQSLTQSSILPTMKHTVVDSDKAKTASVTNASTLGSVSVITAPDKVLVYFDSGYVGTSPYTITGVSPGQHQILLEKDGFMTQTKTVNVTAGQTTILNTALGYSETPTPKSPLGAGFVIASLLAAVCLMAVLRRK
ncbi:MAG: PEGA domain-containing protein [Methanoregula sp.]|nr:PEGA domain-containing protein [Methanoregula sp.]